MTSLNFFISSWMIEAVKLGYEEPMICLTLFGLFELGQSITMEFLVDCSLKVGRTVALLTFYILGCIFKVRLGVLNPLETILNSLTVSRSCPEA